MGAEAVKNAVQAALKAYGAGDTLIVAVSGGMDSMALLYAAHEQSQAQGFALHVAHMNHRLRAEAPQEAAFVQAQAKKLGLPVTVRGEDVLQLAKAHGHSVEDAARRARYAFFAALSQAHNAPAVLLAHHMEDQAETVLLHLLRGSGMTGLTGMGAQTGLWLRPLLGVRRGDIQDYIHALHIQHVTDASNEDNTYMRNHIRNKILPGILTEVNPDAISALCRTAGILREEEAYIHAQAMAALVNIQTLRGTDATALKNLPLALGRRVVRLLCEQAGLKADVEFTHVEQILRLCGHTDGNARMDLPHGYSALREYGVLRVERMQSAGLAEFEISLAVPGVTALPGGCGCIEAQEAGQAVFGAAHDAVQYFDARYWPQHVCVRRRKPGDRMHMLGAPGHKKFKDCLIDHKIPPQNRDMLLLCDGKEVLWAVGLGISHTVRVQSGANHMIKIEYKP